MAWNEENKTAKEDLENAVEASKKAMKKYNIEEVKIPVPKVLLKSKTTFIDMVKHFKDEVGVFEFDYAGGQYAATKEKLARVTISIPRILCGENLKDLEKYHFWVLNFTNETWEKMRKFSKKTEDKNAGVKNQ